jgi:hypothetical protein
MNNSQRISREFSDMNLANHKRRFSMPPPGFVAAPSGAAGLASNKAGSTPNKNALPPQNASLAQIYAMAREQAVAAIEQRQWDLLFKQLFDL